MTPLRCYMGDYDDEIVVVRCVALGVLRSGLGWWCEVLTGSHAGRTIFCDLADVWIELEGAEA